MYHRVGYYRGDMQDLVSRALALEYAWTENPGVYGSTETHVEEKFKDLGDSIPGNWAYSTVIQIPPGGFIPFHKDVPRRENLSRFHMVLATNDKCWNYHEGSWQQLSLGSIYSMDETQEHASLNWGGTPRIHLVVDVDKGAAPLASGLEGEVMLNYYPGQHDFPTPLRTS